jgi:trimeric autotransporter adhesin
MVGKKHKFNLAKHVILTAIICSAYGHAYALPTGEQVQAGNVGFVRDVQSLNINQSSQQAIVNWQSFGIAANEAVKLYQPNQGSALFRVLGSDPSRIFGSLTATGSLFLINPNGVLFAPGAQVNVGSLLATTMQMSDQNYLAKNYQLNGDSNTSVINQGVIRASDGGYLVLLGNMVENSGTLQANNGSVVLGSAQSAMLDFYGDGLVRVKLDGDALNAVIKQSGNINADGGAVQLATNARTAAINVDGVVQANSLVERNGLIRLEGGKGSTVQVSGSLIAKGNSTGLKGGEVTVTGERVALLDGAKVDVSGSTGGGTALIGGDYQGKNADVQNAERTYVAKTATIKADALDSGDGGKVVVWANDITRYYGSVSAKGGINAGNGGFAEVSGKRLLNFLGKADLSAANGLGGSLLLDPLNITLTTVDANTAGFTVPGDLTEAFADDAGLTSSFNVNAGGSFAGIAAGSTITLQANNDINVNTAFNVATATGSTNNSLVLQANNNINVNAAVTTTGTGSIAMTANADNVSGGNLAIGANIISQTGGINLSGANITRSAGNIASTGVAGALNGGNVNIIATTGSIALGAATVTSSGGGAVTAGNAGNITLSAATGVSGTGAITATGGASSGANQTGGNGGAVSVNNTGAGVINVGAITASGGNSGTGNAAGGNAGSIAVANSGGNITTGALTARTGTGIGAGAASVQGFITVNNSSATGMINTGAISTAGNTNGHGGNVTLTGNNAVTVTGALNTNGGTATGARAGRNAGNVTISGLNRTITGAITANGNTAIGAAQAGGNAGLVSISGTGTLNSAAINAQTGAATTTGAGGTVGSITLNGSTIVAGALTTTGGSNGDAGNIGVTSTGNMTVGAVAANGGGPLAGVAGRNAGTVILNSAGTVNAATIAVSGTGGNGATLNMAGGNAGSITVTGVGGVTATTFAASGGAASTTNANGGNAGNITIANSGTGNIGVTTLTAQAGAATGTGAGGAAANILVTNTAAAGNLTATNITSAGNTNANGGNVILSSLGTTTAGSIITSGAASTGTRTGRIAGNVAVSGAAVTTGAITANGAAGIGLNQAGGNAGAVSLAATTGAVVTQAISSVGGAGVATNANGGNGGSVTLDAGAGSTITMNNITTTGGNRAGTGTAGAGGNILVADNALLSADTIITATGGSAGVGTGGTVNFAGKINSTGASRALTINTNAATTLSGAIGDSMALTSFTTNASGSTAINGGAVTTTGVQTYNDAVTLGAATIFTTTNSNVTFGSSVNAGGNNVIANTGTGAVSATNAANNFANLAISAGSANIRDTNAIALGATNVTGAYGLVANGAITQTAGVTVGGATTLNAGVVNDITLNNAGNNFNAVAIASGRDVSLVDANAMTVGASSVRTITARTLSNDLTLGGNITATGTGSGTSITLASAQNFLNPGNSALTPGVGSRWLIYSANPTLDTRGAGLITASNFKQYNTLFGGAISGAGNGFVYSVAPTIAATLTGNATKTYDGNTTAPIGSLTLGQSGAIDGDTVNLSALTSATYDNKNAGVNKTVTSNALNITSATNGAKQVFGYTLASTTASGAVGTISQRAITVTAATDIKTYDATTSSVGAPTITAGSIVSGDSATFSQAFDTKNTGTGKTLTAAGTVNDGNSGNNYAVTFVTNNTGVINQLAITGSVTANNKTYNGNNSATITTSTLTGAIGGDDVAYTGGTATFADKNAGTGKTVTATGLSLSGLDASNYTVNTTAVTTADIAKADITAVTGITANNKVYDATTLASLNTGAAAYTGMIGGDNLTVATATGAFVDQNAGIGKTVNVSGISLGGTDAGNYNLNTTTSSTTADISQRSITVTANPGQSKVFGSADPLPFNFTVGGLGLVGGDTLAGALDRAAGETVGIYAINQGTLAASPNYQLTYFGNNFSILVPSTSGGGGSNPRNSSGLVDLNPMLSNYTNQQLFVLNVGFTAAGNDSTGNQEACEADPESLVKDKDFILMLNYGLKLPKGVNASCDKTSI